MVIAVAAALLLASGEAPQALSAVECDVERAAVAAELKSELHFASTLRRTAIPTEWLWSRILLPSEAEKPAPFGLNPQPTRGLPSASLAPCHLDAVFNGVWRVRRNGTHNLVLATDEQVLRTEREALDQGMFSVMLSRVSFDADRRSATVIFGGYCGGIDALSLSQSPDGTWSSSPPHQLGFIRCEIIVTPGRHAR
jgi:hypothetical protein